MKKSIKKKWLAALRSGKYEQGTGALCEDGKYCCLGVLCEVLPRPKKKSVKYFYNENIVPNRLALKAAGWPDGDSVALIYNGHRRCVSSLNDSAGLSFKQIANLIDKQL